MRARVLVALGVLGGSLAVGAALSAAEGRLEPTPPEQPGWELRPPSENQAYDLDARRKNLEVAGLRGEELAKAEAVAAAVVKDAGVASKALQRLPWQVVRRTLCRDRVPAFHRAAPLLLQGTGDAVTVRELPEGADAAALEPAVKAAEGLYEAFELPADRTRRTDATALLGLAALLVGQGDVAVARTDPWSSPEPGPDPLARVRRTFPAGVRRLPEYLGRVEGLAEVVGADPGVYGCTGGGR